MRLHEIAVPSACMVLPGSWTRDELLERLLDAVARSGACPHLDPRSALTALVARENEAPTAFGLGIAIPHCFLPMIGEPRLSVGCAPQGVAFGAPEGRLTYVVFLLVEDVGRRAAHTEVLSHIARLCRETALVRSLRGAREAGSIPGLIAEAESALA